MLEAPVSELPQLLAEAKQKSDEQARADRLGEYRTVYAAKA
jgi:hypothetical protein